MKNYLLLPFLLLVSLKFNAQHKFNDAGFQVTKADLETNSFIADTTANALVIYETGNSFVDEHTFLLKTEVKRKIKILNKEGFDKAQNELILYDTNKGRKESVDEVKATVYNLNGSKVETSKLSKSQVFEIPEGDHHVRVKFAFPNVKEGSVIVYSYTKKSPFMFNYHGWSFQSDIPKLYSEYNASIPGNWEYNIKLIGGQKLSSKSSKIKKDCLLAGNGGSANCAIYHYAMTNIPAFIDEEFMTTRSNYLARIEYELKTFTGFDGSRDNITKSWKDTDHELKKDKNIGRQLAKSSFLKDVLDEEILVESNDLERAKRVYELVQNNYSWNSDYQIFHEVSVKDLLKEKSGSVAEMNILLHNLLELAGIEVKPILMSTRANGFPTKLFPVMSEFNYLIVQAQIDGKNYMLDATDRFLPFGVLPYRCLNQYGRLIDFENGSRWIDVQPDNRNILTYRSVLELSDNDEVIGHVDVNSTGYKAISNAKKYMSNQNNYLEEFETDYPDVDFISHELTADMNDTESYSERFNLSFQAQKAGSNLYINPFVFMFFDTNPFKLQERTYPIDFGYSDSYNYSILLKLKDGFEVVEAPENKTLGLPNGTGSLTFNTTVQEDSIMMTLKFNFKESIYGPEFYEALKIYFSEIIDIEKNSLIVLKRSS